MHGYRTAKTLLFLWITLLFLSPFVGILSIFTLINLAVLLSTEGF